MAGAPVAAGEASLKTPLRFNILRAMGSLKFVAALVSLGLVLPRSNVSADPLEPGRPPVLSDTQRQFLSHLARRAIRDALLDRPPYEPEYVPNTLQDVEAEAIVRVRRDGYLLATAAGGLTKLVTSVQEAAAGVARELTASRGLAADQLSDCLIEIEAVGPAVPLKVDGIWTEPRALDPFIEPGIHGITISGKGRTRRICPTEFVTSDTVVADAVKSIAPLVQAHGADLSGIAISRFQTVHWYEAKTGSGIINLSRGMMYVSPEWVSSAGLDEAIERTAEYMMYRQQPGGQFSYQYEPSNNRYSAEDNDVRQAGAIVAMAIHARVSGRSASVAAANLGLERFRRMIVPVPGVATAAFVGTPDGANKLGVTALVALAMAEHPQADRFAADRRKLVNGMLWLQRPSGLFVTAFPPAQEIEGQEYFPGEALLALAADYALEPTESVLDAFDRAINFYRGFFRGDPSPAFASWQAQAFARMAAKTKRKDYTEYTFELMDWLAPMLLTSANCDWPELYGGIASYQHGRAGVATASYLEGFTDALWLARAVGDTGRAARYEELVRSSARFVIQLQVRPEEAYFVRSPRDAVGGIRTGPALNLLRIDHCQHALVGLIKTRQVLFPEKG